MQVILLLFLGWPGILLFLGLASIGAWQSKPKMLWLALFFSLGPSLYLLGGNGWVQLIGLYIPLSLVISAILVKHKRHLAPKILLVPLYGFYAWFGYLVAIQ